MKMDAQQDKGSVQSSVSSDSSSLGKKPNCLQKVSSVLAGSLEKFYYMLGVAIAKRPAVTISCVLLAYGLCAVGLIKFYEVDPSDPIWVDPNSEYIRDKTWVDEEFATSLRISSLIVESENILRPASLLELYDFHEKLTSQSGEGYNYSTVCYRLGQGDSAECWVSSILELWEFDRSVIQQLSDQDVINAINSTDQSPVTGSPFNASLLLGGIERDSNGLIVSAGAATVTYYMKSSNSTDDGIAEDEVTEFVADWEQQLIWEVGNYSGDVISSISVLASRSFADEIGTSIFGDISKLAAGYIIIIVYVALVLGQFNFLHLRAWLSLAAVLGIGLSLAVSFGLSSAFGIGYGPVQSILPFLLLGLGVDDAFVIVQAWNRLTADERTLPLGEQAGRALKHAGVSITITSITDFAAFGIGATTVLPALRDFCVYAAIGIVALLIVQSTFFMACVVIDERRKLSRRNACCCCYTHPEDYQPNECSKRDIQQTFFEKVYGPTLVKLPVKIVVLVISLAFLAVGIAGAVYLKQEYDPNSFIPSDSYLRDYLDSFEEYFPELGIDDGYIYLNNTDYYADESKLDSLMQALEQESSVEEGSVDSWLVAYREWLQETNCPWIKSHLNLTTRQPLDGRRFYMLLTPFIYMSGAGRRHSRNINFNGSADVDMEGIFGLQLNSSEILEIEEIYAQHQPTSSRVPFKFVDLTSSAERVQAMDDTRRLVSNFYPSERAFAFSKSFETWETDKIIQSELYRNLGIAFGCVIILTLLLIADIGTCILVSICVMATLAEVAGFMHWWGLTIDTVTCIQLVLAIGLAVDYSAHIGHTFMTVTGSRNERMQRTMADIGPAVFNGGFSTFLAFILLVVSNSYVFQVFFQVNLLVVLLGMWNGMVLLPVLLSWIGPTPYLSAAPAPDSDKTTENQGHDNPALVAQTELNLMDEKPNSAPKSNNPGEAISTASDHSSRTQPASGTPRNAVSVSTSSLPASTDSKTNLPDVA